MTLAPPEPGETLETWKPRQVRKLLNRDGTAHLEGARTRREIMDNGGPDIDSGYADNKVVQSAQRVFNNVTEGSTTWNDAVQELGDIYGAQPNAVLGGDMRGYYDKLANGAWSSFHKGRWHGPPSGGS
ncbi:hypothetical protein [Nocardia sp. NPDC051463]|uniref:hypothetical protein n=1 Tax=Nocardia sp. NPDC051463 TaxID=3154845 RepID=UPI00344F275D